MTQSCFDITTNCASALKTLLRGDDTLRGPDVTALLLIKTNPHFNDFSALSLAGVRMPWGGTRLWLVQIRRSTTESWRGTTINWKKLLVLSSTARSPSYIEPCQLSLRKHNGNLRHQTHTRTPTHRDTQNELMPLLKDHQTNTKET